MNHNFYYEKVLYFARVIKILRIWNDISCSYTRYRTLPCFILCMKCLWQIVKVKNSKWWTLKVAFLIHLYFNYGTKAGGSFHKNAHLQLSEALNKICKSNGIHGGRLRPSGLVMSTLGQKWGFLFCLEVCTMYTVLYEQDLSSHF